MTWDIAREALCIAGAIWMFLSVVFGKGDDEWSS